MKPHMTQKPTFLFNKYAMLIKNMLQLLKKYFSGNIFHKTILALCDIYYFI